MKYDAKLSGIIHATSTEASRYLLQGIYLDVENHVAVATTGAILASIDVTDLLETGVDNFTETSFIIPSDAIKLAAKRSKGRQAGPVCIRKHEDRIAVLQWGEIVQLFDVVDGKFPKYNLAVPTARKIKQEYRAAVSIDAELLFNLQKALAGGECHPLTIWLKDGISPIIVENGESGKLGVIMPVAKNAGNPIPSWARHDATANPEAKDAEAVTV
jgi:DNA polymerase III sliding clamp (beta) subunit (PCNA family)